MKVNIINLRREMEEGLNRSVYPEAQRRIVKYVNNSKKQLIESFENAGPSRELIETAETDRADRDQITSQYVQDGNLYAFMGFEDDRNPVQEVKEILEDQVRLVSLTKGSINNKGDYVITGKVQTPTLDAINQASQIGWSSRGWIDALTKGLRGLPNFLFGRNGEFADGPSRSGAGLQSKGNTGRSEFKPYNGNYLFEFLERFKNKIRGNTQ